MGSYVNYASHFGGGGVGKTIQVFIKGGQGQLRPTDYKVSKITNKLASLE